MVTIKNNKQPDIAESNTSVIAKGDSSESQKFTVAIIILIVYLIFIAFMLYKSDAQDTQDLSWSRMLYLFSGIEAIVFAALGYVFGKDIHRIRAEKAEENADQAKKETDKAKKETDNAKATAQEEKIKGIKLSTAVLSRNYSLPEDYNNKLKGVAITPQIKDNSGDDFLVNLAKSLYEASDGFTTVSFDYEISPADKIDSITINGKTKSSPTGSYSGVPINQNIFTVDVVKNSEFVEWTFKISRIIDSNGKKRKQSGGELVSNRDSANVQLENL